MYRILYKIKQDMFLQLKHQNIKINKKCRYNICNTYTAGIICASFESSQYVHRNGSRFFVPTDSTDSTFQNPQS